MLRDWLDWHRAVDAALDDIFTFLEKIISVR